ncbi:S1 RNA-binding domain-containing protein [Sorangium cellulosum]|uniref:S1 motif domain-containing protein n=1 Tax=Sorangium cellulosum TaxID=56 RepID=A0A150QYC2_SORCE|nr:S1 RNA-binding domain-containing protein [Sorangium cellulosum]KYF72987.1 hypothetical protein BE15_04695 [Sorangium cellulosum]
MSDAIGAVVGRLLSRADLTGVDLSARDLAEILWLRTRVEDPPQKAEPSRSEEPDRPARSPAATSARLVREPRPRTIEVEFADQREVRPSRAPRGGGARLTLQIDAALPLERRLAYTRSLTRLARKGTDRSRLVLDVSATVCQTCQAGRLRTVVRARARAVTNMVVLVDSAGQLDPWRAGIRQLASIVGQMRGFASQSFLEVDADDATGLRFWSAPLGEPGRAEVKLETTFRHGLDNLYVLITDGVGASMVNGAWGRALTSLPSGATAVWIHPWPEEYWPRSGLGRLRAGVPAPLSQHPRAACVPIVEFNPEGIGSLEAWRHSGTASHLLGVRLPLEPERRASVPRASAAVDWGARGRRAVEAFEPITLQLLALAAAVPGWLDMSLLYALGRRFCMAPVSRYALAEAMSSGFFERAQRDARGVLLRFRSSEARAAMLSYLPTTHIARVFRFLVDEHLSERRGALAGRLQIPLHLLMREVAPDRASLTPEIVHEEMALEGYAILHAIHAAVAAGDTNVNAGRPRELVPASEEAAADGWRIVREAARPLSRDEVVQWAEIEDALRSQQIVDAVVIGVSRKEALSVRLWNGVVAELRRADIDRHPVSDLQVLIGRDIKVRLLHVDPPRRRALVSRRLASQVERQRRLGELKPGAVVTGWVKSVKNFGAFVDLDGIDGLLHHTEISYYNSGHPADVVAEGQELTLKVLTVDPIDERVTVSLRAVVEADHLRRLGEFKPGDVVTGKVKSIEEEHGAFVDLGDIDVFLPVTEMLHDKDEHPADLVEVGQELTLTVLTVDLKNGRVIVSLKEANRQRRLSELQPGDVVTGRVKRIVAYGALIDLGGIDGLLHVNEMSYTKVSDPLVVVHKNQELTLRVKSVNRQRRKVQLSLRQMHEDPWVHVGDRYAVGARVRGRVSKIVEYGAFVELEPGVQGLIPRSELSWDKKAKHPTNFVELGQEVECQVLDVDVSAKRISLSLKQLTPDPWVVFRDKHRTGDKISGKVVSTTDYGVFVGIEGIVGMAHRSDISWTIRVNNPRDLYRKDDVVEAILLLINHGEQKILLGIKQLRGDPWPDLATRLKQGTEFSDAEIVGVSSSLVYLRLSPGVEAVAKLETVEPELATRLVRGAKVRGTVVSTDDQCLVVRVLGLDSEV